MQPGCIPSPMVIEDDDHQFSGGEKKARLRALPRPELQGSSSSELGRRAGRVGAYLRVGRRLASSSNIRGRKTSSSSAEEASSSHAGEAELLLSGQGAAVRPPPRAAIVLCAGQPRPRRRLHDTLYAARAVLMFWDGPILILMARTGVRTCWCALGRPPLDGTVLVGRWPMSSVLRWWSPWVRLPLAEAVASADETVSATCASDLRLFGFNGWFSSSARGRERGPFSSSVCPEAITAFVLLLEAEVIVALLQWSPASHLEFVVLRALWCGGCSYPREWNRISVCNGTLSMGVCSLWLSRPEHLGI
jgi:hypothetical protein